jgi:hypothetical protein
MLAWPPSRTIVARSFHPWGVPILAALLHTAMALKRLPA